MPSLADTLASIPGYGAYIARRQMNEQQPMQELQQAGAALSLQGILEKQGQEAQLRKALAESGGDPDAALKAALTSGNVGAAAKLSPIIQARETAATRKEAQAQRAQQFIMQLDQRQDVLDQKREEFLQRTEDAKQRTMFEQWYKGESLKNRQAQDAISNQLRAQGIELQRRDMQPLVPIVGPDGKPVLATRELAVGKTPAGAGSKAEAVEAGKADVDKDIITLKSAIDSLHEGGGITSTTKGVLSNVGRWASNTGVGQTLGSMGGTYNQKARDVIAQARPLLLRSIMQATGMSARSLDSNAELKLWLSTATDPTKGYEANIEALNNIARKYGSGGFMVMEFATEAEAIASGVKGKVKIGGRNATIQ